jgi:septal ring factor EnvC (AmiA/AmiB activator)
MEGYNRRVEQVEDRISKLEGKIEIKEKTEEILVKQLKSHDRNIQELTESIKRPNMRIMLFEGKKVQVKGNVIYSIK